MVSLYTTRVYLRNLVFIGSEELIIGCNEVMHEGMCKHCLVGHCSGTIVESNNNKTNTHLHYILVALSGCYLGAACLVILVLFQTETCCKSLKHAMHNSTDQQL